MLLAGVRIEPGAISFTRGRPLCNAAIFVEPKYPLMIAFVDNVDRL
jgi:hypothetical protein